MARRDQPATALRRAPARPMRREFGAVFAAKRGRRRLAAGWAMPRRSAARESNRGPLRLAAGSTRHPDEALPIRGCASLTFPLIQVSIARPQVNGHVPSRVDSQSKALRPFYLPELAALLTVTCVKSREAPSAWAIAGGLSNLILRRQGAGGLDDREWRHADRDRGEPEPDNYHEMS